MNEHLIENEIDFFAFDFDDSEDSDIDTICLHCGYTEKVPDFIYDEISSNKYHFKINKRVPTLYCRKCQKETAIPNSFAKNR